MSSTARYDGARAALSIVLLLSFLLVPLLAQLASADPTGGSISDAVTEYTPNTSPDSRADPRSTITTMLLTALQPDQHWKAYVGNVTGSLTLDDAANFTIYDWDITTITGNVFASRYDNISWSSVSCAPVALTNNESTFHNMTVSDSDRMNATFNWTIHKQFDVGSTTISASTCNSTVTYANDTRQVPTTTSPFQEILIRDTNDYLVYLTSIENNVQGFDNLTYDFQMIVAESDVKASPTTYYFYVELR